MPSNFSLVAHSPAAVSVRIPLLMAVTEAKGSRRSPALVLTMIAATRDRSSWGASASSRTLPHLLPAVSKTGAPSSSESASVGITLRILNCQAGIHLSLRSFSAPVSNRVVAGGLTRAGVADLRPGRRGHHLCRYL